MIAEYLKNEVKVVCWHLIAQIICLCLYFGVFLLLAANYRVMEIFTAILLSGFYVVYMYSKMYKIGEHDTKSYALGKPYPFKGIVLVLLLTAVNFLMAYLYALSFRAGTLLSQYALYFPFKIWGISYAGVMVAPDGSISTLFWLLYYMLPVIVCGFGYFSGMHRWEVGYHFFKNLVYRKKD